MDKQKELQTKQKLLNMELHQQEHVGDNLYVRRVFGGWIYTDCAWNAAEDICINISQCFVPEIINVESHTTDVTDRTHEY